MRMGGWGVGCALLRMEGELWEDGERGGGMLGWGEGVVGRG